MSRGLRKGPQLASITLENVVVEFPIYGAQKSFRQALFARTGGLIRREGRQQGRVTVRALDNVSLHLEHGDRLGIVGHNGSGKTTLLRVIAGVYEPMAGRVDIEGSLSPLFNTAPGLDLDDTGYDNIVTCGLYLGMTPEQIEQKTLDIIKFTELGDYLSLPVRTYSAGMQVRLGFAIATSIDPDILILDEGIGAGDARFAEAAAKRVDALIKRSSILVLASHSDHMVQQMCNKGLLLHGGKAVAFGTTGQILEMYRGLNAGTPLSDLASAGQISGAA